MPGRIGGWAALALLPLLSGCLGAVALPLLAGGSLMVADKHRVRAATRVSARESSENAALSGVKPVLTTLTALPPPDPVSPAGTEGPWQKFFAYAQAHLTPAAAPTDEPAQSALLVQPPSIASATRLACAAQVPSVVIDLDDGAQNFAPERLAPAPAAVAEGLAGLRQAGVVVLWISRLPASRAGEVARALRTAGFDPQGQDQLLLRRNDDDRKQLLRQDAEADVCVVAIAGDRRGDFDELFDYLRDPDSAFALDRLIGEGWFLVPSLSAPASTER
jgi:hypothetical protein